MVGLYFLIGIQATIGFFFKKGKTVGSALFFIGLFIMIIRWTFFGLILQLIGIFMLFKYFFTV